MVEVALLVLLWLVMLQRLLVLQSVLLLMEGLLVVAVAHMHMVAALPAPGVELVGVVQGCLARAASTAQG